MTRPWFKGQPSSALPAPTPVGIRKMYYYLLNVEEHPEVLPLAYDQVAGRLDAAAANADGLLAPPATFSEATDSLDRVLGRLAESGARFSRPWRQATEDLTRRQVLHFFTQYLPMALVDGCWLQGGLEVAMAHTPVGASLTGLYQHQVRAFVADPGRHFVADYRAVHARLGAPLEEMSSRSFIDRTDFHDTSLPLPVFLLSIAQFARSFCAEVLGVNLAWQLLGLPAFGPDLIQDTCEAYGLPRLGDGLGLPDHLEKGRGMAREAAVQLLEAAEPTLADAWERLLRGIHAGTGAWTEWFDRTCEAAPTGPPDPRQEMIDMLWRKAPHACGYHADRRLGGKRIDEHLAPETFDGPALLADLARSPWVHPGAPDRSALLKRLIGFGGPMLSVFSPVEVQIIESWIDSLPPQGNPSPVPARPTNRQEEAVVGPLWTPAGFRRRSENLYRRCTVRELYYYLINVEFHSDVLPVAERFARDRLERSMARLWKGDRPIPSRQYDPAALERWVYQKHRQQVESYRPPDGRPRRAQGRVHRSHGPARPAGPHRRRLASGDRLAGAHPHYGRADALPCARGGAGRGQTQPSTTPTSIAICWRRWERMRRRSIPGVCGWPRLKDASFDVPALWLSISCFPRHFLPEILGLNLAVELAGVGGPYMEARDTLRRFGYPTLFVDVHNAADNVSVGHAAWAMKAIRATWTTWRNARVRTAWITMAPGVGRRARDPATDRTSPAHRPPDRETAVRRGPRADSTDLPVLTGTPMSGSRRSCSSPSLPSSSFSSRSRCGSGWRRLRLDPGAIARRRLARSTAGPSPSLSHLHFDTLFQEGRCKSQLARLPGPGNLRSKATGNSTVSSAWADRAPMESAPPRMSLPGRRSSSLPCRAPLPSKS